MLTRASTYSFSPQGPFLCACHNCGDNIFGAEASEYTDDGQIGNFWSCDACGHTFRTSIRVNVEGKCPRAEVLDAGCFRI